MNPLLTSHSSTSSSIISTPVPHTPSPRLLAFSKGSKDGPSLASLGPGNDGKIGIVAKIHCSVLVLLGRADSVPPQYVLAKAIEVELSYEGGELVVLEELGYDRRLE
jgi:hypothetical protein